MPTKSWDYEFKKSKQMTNHHHSHFHRLHYFCLFFWATIWNMHKWQVSSKKNGEFVHRLGNKMRERAGTVLHQVMKTWHLTVTASVTFAYYFRASCGINRRRSAGWSQTDLILKQPEFNSLFVSVPFFELLRFLHSGAWNNIIEHHYTSGKFRKQPNEKQN